MPDVSGILDQRLLENTLRSWMLAFAIFLATFTILPLLRRYLASAGRRLAERGRSAIVELLLQLIASTHRVFLWVLALYAAQRSLHLPPLVERIAGIVVVAILWLQVGIWARATLDHYLEQQRHRRGTHDPAFASSITLIRFLGRAVLWSVVLLLALDNLGVEVTTLIAGLGIGGIAVALAAQTLLKDLFSSLSIALDKPFVVGDNIVVDALSGTIEHIGIRSTRVRSADGEQIVFANSDLLASRVRNFGRMEERRGVLGIGVSSGTPLAKLKTAGQIIEAAIRTQPGVRFERCHLKELGGWSLNFEAMFFVLDPKMDALANAQHAIHLYIHEAFAREGIEFAYPTQRLILERVSG